ncbi:MAG: DNA-processing protein DprA [Planctomycetota bacterium]|jgi:DNA processing protein
MARDPHDVPEATLRLLLARGLGPATLSRLRAHFGSDDAATSATTAQLATIEGIGQTTAAAIRRSLDQADPDQERRAMRGGGVRLILRGDDDYPVLLEPIPDPPAALWVRGRLAEYDRLAVAVVGSRRCTAYGREQAGRLAGLLAECGLTIVSGGAAGIDGEAHRGAMRVGGRTIAVMGCGLAGCYPPQHDELFERIVSQDGALLSDYPMLTEPRPGHFPQRNRIISGLSLGVLVVEAARRSGALITARRATEEQGREVMALPGRVDSPASSGCLEAIRDGWAGLVTNHADVLSQLDSSSHLVRGALEMAGHVRAATSGTLFDGNLTEGQQAIVEVLREAGETLLVDQVAARSRLPMSRVLADLTLLQIRGRVLKDRAGVRLVHP